MTLDAQREAARACYLAAADRCLEEGSELDAMLLASDGTEAISRVHHGRLAAGCPARTDPLAAAAAGNASPRSATGAAAPERR